MTAHIINGKEIVGQVRAQIKQEVQALAVQGIQPGLVVVLVGDDAASAVYVRNKAKSCEEAGIYSEVARLNADDKINGILVQLPLPKHIDEDSIIDSIAVEKDVDCFHPINVGNLMIGKESFLPCTPSGVIAVLKHLNLPIAGKHAVVIGRSNIVGKPMAMLLLRENATVTICHSKTPNMEEITRQADILIVAVGRAQMVKRSFIKPGAVVIDVGMNRLDTGKLVGDVDFDDVAEVAGYLTPVPGCVGPMTITMLLRNTLEAAKRANLSSVHA
jgi:methylenetetrahydrofolate dehydrogenase (NADP+)/methenyltetrahydrofolate cyclohydrolase